MSRMFTIYTNSSLSYMVNTHFFGQHKVCYEFFAEYLSHRCHLQSP